MLLAHTMQSELFADAPPETATAGSAERKQARSGTFADNMKLPIHRWFRYSAGFSAEWVDTVVRAYQGECHTNPVVLDPFSGSGTAVIAAAAAGASAFGFESHPFVVRIAHAKSLWPQANTEDLRQAAIKIISEARSCAAPIPEDTPTLLLKCYEQQTLSILFAMRDAFLAQPPADQATRELLWLSITSILRPCSHAGTAQWQYVLPNKTKSCVLEPCHALELKVSEIIFDVMAARRSSQGATLGHIINHDARQAFVDLQGQVDLVITSPPYPNNYDYADATRLEMMFWGEIASWSDLQGSVRQHIVCSCSQHSAADRLNMNELLAADAVAPIVNELTNVCRTLETVRLTKGGKKTYHTMVAAYFVDLARIMSRLRQLCKKGARLCFVIGDSAPYGVHVPVEKWLAQLALHAGFRSHTFEKLRDRNIKWKNRKHRVPLLEGRLWIEG
jgi:methylase of polypeptide subunit release factors